MSKKHFIALANTIHQHNLVERQCNRFSTSAILKLADFCQSQNPMFKRARWLAYIRGECGQNGGTVK